jgi:hypothetical protein
MGVKYKYKINDKCKTVGWDNSAIVKGYCCNWNQNNHNKKQDEGSK